MICEESVNKVLPFPARAVAQLPHRATLYASLERAKRLLASQVMTEADARAWLDLDDLQERLLRQV